MYRITILTKNGNAAIHDASDEVFNSFKGWLIGGEGTAESDPAYYGSFMGGLPGNTLGGITRQPCSTFLFADGAIHRDNIDTVSWEQRAPRPAAQPRQQIEMLDEAPVMH